MLEKLPLEVFQQICEYLPDRCANSLLSLALTSKQVSFNVFPLIHRNLKINLTGRDSLKTNVNRRILECQRRSTTSHVRSLEVTGSMNSDTGSSWLPLVNLIHTFSGLSDLYFNCLEIFPSCVLSTIHQMRNFCRLHIGHFSLYPFYFSEKNSPSFNILLSPNLYALRLECKHRFHLHGYCHCSEAALRIAAAPNIKELYIVSKLPARAGTITHWRRSRSRPPRFKELNDQATRRIGVLERLDIGGFCPVLKDDIQSWHGFTDFRTLRILKLHTIFECNRRGTPDSGAAFELLATFELPSLRALSLHFPGVRQTWCQPEPYFSHVASFLRRLNSLTALELTGDFHCILIDAIAHLWRTLNKLVLAPSFATPGAITMGVSDIQRLVKQYPLLDVLVLTISTNGDDSVDSMLLPYAKLLFEALGSSRRLQHLSLLFPTRSTVVRSSFASLDNVEYKTRASEIFQAISSSKILHSVPLASLFLQVKTLGSLKDQTTWLDDRYKDVDIRKLQLLLNGRLRSWYPCWLVEQNRIPISDLQVQTIQMSEDSVAKVWPYAEI